MSRSAENPAFVFFTSGTTGQPKGAVLTHLNLVRNATVNGFDANDARPTPTTSQPHFGTRAGTIGHPIWGVEVEESIAWSWQRLGRHQYPRRIRFVEELPLGPGMKVLKRELRRTLIEAPRPDPGAESINFCRLIRSRNRCDRINAAMFLLGRSLRSSRATSTVVGCPCGSSSSSVPY